MAANKKVYLVKNIGHVPCKSCSGDHEYMSRSSEHARCGTPVGLSREVAEATAEAHGWDIDEAVVLVPDDTYIVLDDSARKLKKQASAVVLDQQMMGVSTA